MTYVGWWVMIGASFVVLAAAFVEFSCGHRTASYGLEALCFWIQTAADLLYGARPIAVVPFAAAVWVTWKWWKGGRRGRDKAAKMLGDKSRALLDALVRRAREIAVPRPVLAPQLYGRT